MLPVFRRFTQQDVPTAPNWIANVFGPLNLFCEQTVQTLNKNLTIGDNVQGQKFSTTFTTLGLYLSGKFTPITFQYTGGGQPTACLIGRIARTDGTLILTTPMVSSWFVNLNTNPYTITINYIAGLDINTQYSVNLVVL